MNRRSFLQSALASLGVAATVRSGPSVQARIRDAAELPNGSSPDVFDEARPWVGRIVRQTVTLPGQKQMCCVCMGPGDLRCGLGYKPGDPCEVGRTPTLGSPELAYLERVAVASPHSENEHSEWSILRRIESGELSIEDVYVRLASAEEIDAPGSGYAGGRGEAYASYLLILA